MSPEKTTSLPGVFLNLYGLGVLLTGESRTGKSSIALDLIHRGHHLIADDVVELSVHHNTVLGRCPISLQNKLEIRGFGIMNIRELLGDNVIQDQSQLDLIIHLKKNPDDERIIDPITTMTQLLGHSIKTYYYHPSFPNTSLIVEIIAKYHLNSQTVRSGQLT